MDFSDQPLCSADVIRYIKGPSYSYVFNRTANHHAVQELWDSYLVIMIVSQLQGTLQLQKCEYTYYLPENRCLCTSNYVLIEDHQFLRFILAKSLTTLQYSLAHSRKVLQARQKPIWCVIGERGLDNDITCSHFRISSF